jgi:hypothetical protein
MLTYKVIFFIKKTLKTQELFNKYATSFLSTLHKKTCNSICNGLKYKLYIFYTIREELYVFRKARTSKKNP